MCAHRWGQTRKDEREKANNGHEGGGGGGGTNPDPVRTGSKVGGNSQKSQGVMTEKKKDALCAAKLIGCWAALLCTTEGVSTDSGARQL